MTPVQEFLRARDFLLARRDDQETASRSFGWPECAGFNWALDYFDRHTEPERTALWRIDERGAEERVSFAELRARSNRVANHLRAHGVRRGDAILVMLGNVAPLWEVTLAALKLGAVISPASTLLLRADIEDRLERGSIRHVVTDEAGTARFSAVKGSFSRFVIGGPRTSWIDLDSARAASDRFVPDDVTAPDDPFLLYFTSGTTSKPKIVAHTQRSYPIGHLSTMFWIGLQPGDVHWNISSPGWAKHAWSSFFAPWNANATVFTHDTARFDARRTLELLAHHRVTTLCAPPTVWRLLILEDLALHRVHLREVVSAGEPLNPEVIERVRRAWGLTIRDGYGQTESTCMIGNAPGSAFEPGSMGRPMPGYRVSLLDPDGREALEGEIAIHLEPRPAGLMAGYADSPERSRELLGGDFYRTSDVARRNADGSLTYVGRADDVFKSADYRISPFEIESALIEHESVAEAAVVPSPDARRGTVPKAFVTLRPGLTPSRALAVSILRFLRDRVAPYKRVRRIEFAELPKTISGKIRRVELRALEVERRAHDQRGAAEFWEDELDEL